MADNIRMGAGGVPYKVQSEPKKDEVISEVLEVNPNKMEEKKKSKKVSIYKILGKLWS